MLRVSPITRLSLSSQSTSRALKYFISRDPNEKNMRVNQVCFNQRKSSVVTLAIVFALVCCLSACRNSSSPQEFCHVQDGRSLVL